MSQHSLNVQTLAPLTLSYRNSCLRQLVLSACVAGPNNAIGETVVIHVDGLVTIFCS